MNEISLPCWCDARCMDDCTCIFHGHPDGGYDCGSPKTRADVFRVAEEVAEAGQSAEEPSLATFAALDWLDDGGRP